jgi:putative DNA primase/helicase
MPALSAFNERLEEILDYPAPIDDAGALTPLELTLSPEAKALWIEYHDDVERDLGQGGDLNDVKDVASKSADNAARLAALFAFFERGAGAIIGEDDFRRAAQIALWHLSEARRFLGEFCMPEELTHAARLESWLIKWCRKKGCTIISCRDIQQYGPYGLRRKAPLNAAFGELFELGRAREVKTGTDRGIHINPAVLGGAS